MVNGKGVSDDEEAGITNEKLHEINFNIEWAITVLKADWLVEIADRKTENSSEIPNNSTISKMEQVGKE